MVTKKISLKSITIKAATAVLKTVVVCSLFSTIPAAFAQMKTQVHDIKAPNGSVYRVFIAIPQKKAPKAGWPTLYLLDGNATFPLAKTHNPDAILVAVGYPTDDNQTIIKRRFFDLTSKAAPDKIPLRPGMTPPKTGGEKEFRYFITHSLMTDINKNFNVDPAKATLFGHSLGGVFALRTALESAQPFSAFCAADPAIWWNGHEFMKNLAAFHKTTASMRFLIETSGKRVLPAGINAKEAEKINTLRKGPGGRQVADILRNQKAMKVKFHLFADEAHGTMIAPAVRDCIAFTLNLEHPSL